MQNNHLSPKYIQPVKYMEPFRVLKTLNKNHVSVSYLVNVKYPDGQKEKKILQVFPAGQAQAFKTTKEVLSKEWKRDIIECFEDADGVGYILIQIPGDPWLTWKKIAAMPLPERIEMVMAIAYHLEELDHHNILFHDIKITNLFYHASEQTVECWDFSGAVSVNESTPDELVTTCRAGAFKQLATFAYYAIMGKVSNKENALTNLLLALCHKLPQKHIEELAKAFTDSSKLTFSDFIELLDETCNYLSKKLPRCNMWKNPDQCLLAAADFLDHNPLTAYVQEDARGNKHLNVLLLGKSPMRWAFFSTIFACAQMLDTQLHIHVIAKDADAFYDQCIAEAPLLSQTAVITHIPARQCSDTLNAEITGKDRSGKVVPFAYLTFEKVDTLPTAEALQQHNAGCIFLLDAYNDAVSNYIKQFVSQNQTSLLLGIHNPMPVIYDEKHKNASLHLRSFVRTRSGYGRKAFGETNIYQKALDIHTFYSKGGDQRVTREKILDDFNDIYNRDSSIRSALTIPYKLHAFGLTAGTMVSEQFATTVLTNPDHVNRLVWLEHRSWQAHMIIRGWTLGEKPLTENFIDHQMVHQSKDKKWHACLLGCHDTKDSPLEQWTKEDWDSRDITRLDPLDQLSVELYRTLAAAVKNEVETDLDACLEILKENFSNDVFLFEQIQNAINRLKLEATNATVIWNRLKKELPEDEQITKLCQLANHLINRNKRRNFKVSDRDIVQAIPYLLRDMSIQHVYKLCANHPWDNVAVSFYVEPQNLTLLTEEKHDVTEIQQQHMLTFLQDRRYIQISICKEPLNELRKAAKNAVLDITGATAEQVLTAQQHPVLSKLPMIYYRDEKLLNPDGKFQQIRFYPVKKSLTVEETLALTGTKVSTENVDIPMHRLHQYQEMWKTARSVDSYTKISGLLSTFRKQYKVLKKDNVWITNMSYEKAKKYGIIALLQQMRSKGLVTYDNFQEVYVQNGLTCKDGDKSDLFEILEKQIDAGELKPCSNLYVTFDKDGWKIKKGPKAYVTLVEKPPFKRQYSRQMAEDSGLFEMLIKLKNAGILEFCWHNRNADLEVKATDPDCQPSLNSLLSAYIAAPKDKRRQLKLHFVTDDPHIFCTLDDMSLTVCEQNALQDNKVVYSCNYENEKLDFHALKTGLKIFSQYGLIHKDYKCEVVPASANSSEKVEIQFTYTDEACMDCLTKAGNALEAFAYHTIRQMGIFDDVKLGVNVFWNDQYGTGNDTKNEIDLICTKGVKTYFISCKNTEKIQTDYLTEIHYEASRFGVDSTPILLTTAIRKQSPAAYPRAQHMGIEIINLQKYASNENELENSANVLRTALNAIVEKNRG